MASLPVDAHTGVNTVNGLLDGLVHPLIGFDHLLVMIAMGVLTTTSVLILVGIMLSLLAKSKMKIMRAVFSVVCAVVGLTLLVHF